MGGITYTWDANGNLLSDGKYAYAYDAANRLASASEGAGISSYLYNGLGDRLQQTVNGQTISYTLDLNDGLTQVLQDGTYSYLYGNARISQESTAPEYFLGDALGSVRQLAYATGTISLSRNYDPYGNLVNQRGSSSSRFGYAGEQTDSYIKLIYLRSRMYSPLTGRFLTKDSWQGDYNSPLSFNRWSYTEGDPVNSTDPSGMAIKSRWDYLDGDPYYRFDRTLDYIYSEMITNSQGQTAEVIREMLAGGYICNDIDIIPAGSAPARVGGFWGAYLLFAIQVRPNGPWDHKPMLREMLSIGSGWDDQYYPIRGDENNEYFYDIWSNIHFGYVGASIGFSRETLQLFANLEKYAPPWLKPLARRIAGQYDPSDEISVNIGIDLWEGHGISLTTVDLHNAILARTPDYFITQDINGNGIIDIDEIDPVKGKLLPRDSDWSDWR